MTEPIYPDVKIWTDRWQEVARLSPGNQGFAIKAKNSDNVVAFLKVLQSNSTERRARMFREVTALANLDIAGVPRLIESNAAHFADRSYELYVASEFIDGSRLSDAVSADKVSAIEAIDIARAICEILIHVHERGVFHRDIKPDNVILQSADQRPHLVDFGMAYIEEAADEFATDRGVEIGNRFLRLPEFSSGFDPDRKRSARSDATYCIGLLHFMLTKIKPSTLQDENGAYPHQRPNARAMLRASGLGYARLLRFFDKGFQANADQRFQSAHDVMDGLVSLLETQDPRKNVGDLVVQLRERYDTPGRRSRASNESALIELWLSFQRTVTGVVGEIGAGLKLTCEPRSMDETSRVDDYLIKDPLDRQKSLCVTCVMEVIGTEIVCAIESAGLPSEEMRVSFGGPFAADDFRAIQLFCLRAIEIATSDDRFETLREIEESPYVLGAMTELPPMDRVPEEQNSAENRPVLDIGWYIPHAVNGIPTLSWKLTNVSAHDAVDVSIFLPGIRSYRVERIEAGKSITEEARFDDRLAYHDHMKGPLQTIVEFENATRIYRQHASVVAFPTWQDREAEYMTSRLGHPYLVSTRIVEPDVGKDRFFQTEPSQRW